MTIGNYGSTGKRPRHWANEIRLGQATIDQVPELFRGMVETYLSIGEDDDRREVENHVATILKLKTLIERRSRLEQVPKGLRSEVEKLVLERFKNKR